MTGILLIVVMLVAAVLVWLKRGKGAKRSAMFENSGLSYFKVLLRQRGVDVSRIPDAALADIIRAKIAAAKTQATVAGMTDATRSRKNWRINLVKSLEAEATLMVSLMASGAEVDPASDAAIALTRHGVFKPRKPAGLTGMTPEQFLDATRRGTLYSELGERRAKRETS
ncbi:hypothetical protein [Rhizobium tumorigenes]|uniref:hypothetical protein n=1 Tax=Rhizobium tumorigenes TaxID=2041385 RepID=UPI00241C6B26|nr:hypothetical protein [Rhizobium tumorigenes]WFS02064.1 hypothetical protein PR016_05450 [Rhizobium tumorigenes]